MKKEVKETCVLLVVIFVFMLFLRFGNLFRNPVSFVLFHHNDTLFFSETDDTYFKEFINGFLSDATFNLIWIVMTEKSDFDDK